MSQHQLPKNQNIFVQKLTQVPPGGWNLSKSYKFLSQFLRFYVFENDDLIIRFLINHLLQNIITLQTLNLKSYYKLDDQFTNYNVQIKKLCHKIIKRKIVFLRFDFNLTWTNCHIALNSLARKELNDGIDAIMFYCSYSSFLPLMRIFVWKSNVLRKLSCYSTEHAYRRWDSTMRYLFGSASVVDLNDWLESHIMHILQTQNAQCFFGIFQFYFVETDDLSRCRMFQLHQHRNECRLINPRKLPFRNFLWNQILTPSPPTLHLAPTPFIKWHRYLFLLTPPPPSPFLPFLITWVMWLKVTENVICWKLFRKWWFLLMLLKV